ncbi:YggT family protein [Corynebacterium mendelii]|uniref:YggT family protein n=1 Tax=Corynebacterium mendelii TaxID=2765362 RepID=A0A939DYF3_9CORY|nr:YggT family protein [Corynebacterium mendelii]
MSILKAVLLIAISVYVYVLIARIIIEMIGSFSRNFQPPRWFSIIAEPLFVLTDPPLRALRRVIPPLKLGNIALDVSVLVLFFGLQLLTWAIGVYFPG